ncbi:acyl-CoA dehydrogenase family protein [Pseudochelatococcus contaminans]|uniref:Alkylation response protein AidB-like acyl-CoA dehydrogenase n=1 Tax=Pseudochelatococcus contaminans TaxID=1538103 RepID=A0A7W6EHT4_9HYPH|nr:acyl-CoA dehydrogenase family protein [Pseudochelatococcus contaminans]MBB3810454.1 alkylation response protein AidB-like acyl-CoA dehydrogenase [Pseudochelatococcus contaminans]
MSDAGILPVEESTAATGATAIRPRSPELSELIEAVAADAVARDRGELPAQPAIELVRQARLGAFRLPVEQGGGGASLPELYALIIDLAAADSNIPHILRNHFAFVERALRAPGSDKLQRWREKARDGKLFGLGASELGIQNIGSGYVETLLTPQGDGYVLNGRKFYSTGNYYTDFIVVQARTPEGEPVSAVVRTAQAGVNVDDDWDGIGQRLTASGTSIFTDVPVAAGDVLFQSEQETRLPFNATFAQLYLTSIVTGILRRIVQDATALVSGRGRNYYHAVAERPADDPLLQQTVGRLASVAYVAEAAVLRAAEALGDAFASASAGKADVALFEEAALRAAKAKIVIDELALSAATQLFDVGGASAATQSKSLDRHWRNIRTISSHNPLAYKARAIGNHVVNGAALPNGAFF